MVFENIELPITDLPDFKTVNLNGVEKSYKKIIWINTALIFLLLFAAPIVFLILDFLPIWIPITVLTIVSVIFTFQAIEIEKGFPRKKFGIRQHDIIYQNGYFYFKEIVVPFNRIQHVEVKQGPLSRIFKLYALKLYTAGASSGDLVINGLSKDNAQKLKSKVLAKTSDIDE
ncbi:PH domain-containing protein [Psychroflexus aestuariivivens]|uniref:PH domain-containing protein n=1 Tax=Psychroflexus aestuariivivens TaxID=1795040 RepID=UPI000FD7B6AD|nr:PH domain-containing protein [Psychroflexus aestuariivivens]